MSLWHAAILGLVEGLTEYLPISSTGHLILVAALLGLDHPPETKHAVDAFTIVIQSGAILAVLALYRARVAQMLRGVRGALGGAPPEPVGWRLARNLAIAFAPAAVVGVLLGDWIGQRLFAPGPVIAALAVGGATMIAIDRWQQRFFHGDEHAEPRDLHSAVDLEHLTWRRALVIGLLQCLAMWPGTSRSMVTIVGGMLVGMRPRQAAEFSFLLGLPTLGAACVYKLAGSLLGDEASMFESLGWPAILLGVSVAALAAAVAVRWLVAFLGRHGLAVFGWYRLALCALFAVLVWRGDLTIAPPAEPEASHAEAPTWRNE